MDKETIYRHYCEYCRTLGIKPATKDEYFRVTGRF